MLDGREGWRKVRGYVITWDKVKVGLVECDRNVNTSSLVLTV